MHFKGAIIKGASHFTKCNNPHTQTMITKEEYEESFKRLKSLGFGHVEITTWNNKTCSIFKKKALRKIASDHEVLDKWQRNAPFKESEWNCNFTETASKEKLKNE